MHVSNFIVYDERNLYDLFKNIDNIFNDGTTVHTDRNTTKKIHFADRDFAVKSFKTPNLLQRFGYANFKKTKAQRSLEFSHKIIDAGLHSPKPIGYVISINNLQIQKSYYISEFHSFEHDLVPVFDNFDKHISLLNNFIKNIIIMHNQYLYHHDLTKRNILINTSSDNNFSFVDNNRMSFTKMSLKMRMESISKLTNDISNLNKLATMYSNNSNYDTDQCIYYIQKGFKKSQRYKNVKNFLKGN